MKFDIELSWSDFKTSCLDNINYSWIYFDVNNHYNIYAKQNDFTVICKIYKDSGADQTDFEDNYQANQSAILRSNVQTQFERTDIVLKTAKVTANFSSGSATLSLKVPGTPGTGEGRYIAGGYAISDVFTLGDKLTEINVIDIDNILGYGANTVIQTYHDEELGAVNQGWYIWPTQSSFGEIEIDPMGYYGFIPAGLYLQLKFECASSTKVCCDVWWGKSVE